MTQENAVKELRGAVPFEEDGWMVDVRFVVPQDGRTTEAQMAVLRYWNLAADGTATCPGVDYGNGTTPIKVWARRGDILMLKVPGGKHWSDALNPSVSHPGVYLVLRVVDTFELSDGSSKVRCEELLEAPLSEAGRSPRHIAA